MRDPGNEDVFLRDMLRLILKEISFHFSVQIDFKHRMPQWKNKAVSLTNVFTAAHSLRKIDDVFSLRNIISEQINKFIELANNNLPTKKFDSRLKLQIQKLSWIHVYGGEISTIESILNTCAYFKPTRNLSNARTSPPATLQASGKALSKTKPYGF